MMTFKSLAVPGSPQNLRSTSEGDQCDTKLFYLHWQEPGRRDRNGCIDKYVINYMVSVEIIFSLRIVDRNDLF